MGNPFTIGGIGIQSELPLIPILSLFSSFCLPLLFRTRDQSSTRGQSSDLILRAALKSSIQVVRT
ncbi:hypothetical protein [Bacteroides finegoldii]|uniref:hypothetical protein n=1 Tax=Bacteroides finegoldii TaxID=338188 RepID=UPI00242CD6AF|nr:hypothetical protein [Bacteroides finegoldii]